MNGPPRLARAPLRNAKKLKGHCGFNNRSEQTREGKQQQTLELDLHLLTNKVE